VNVSECCGVSCALMCDVLVPCVQVSRRSWSASLAGSYLVICQRSWVLVVLASRLSWTSLQATGLHVAKLTLLCFKMSANLSLYGPWCHSVSEVNDVSLNVDAVNLTSVCGIHVIACATCLCSMLALLSHSYPHDAHTDSNVWLQRLTNSLHM